MPLPANSRVWITGASSGIGAALTQVLLAGGVRVAASGRRLDALEALRPPGAPDQLLPLVFDVCDADATAAAAQTIKKEWGGVDWVIANAGDCIYINPQEEWDTDALRRMMEINFFGCVNTAAAALPLLEQATGRGLFAAVTSAAVLAPLPRGGAYGAAKAATGYFIESLRGHYPQIDFSIVMPGFVKTPLTDKNDFPMPGLMTAPRAARLIVRQLDRRRARIRFPRHLIAGLHLIDLLPARLQQRLLAKMARRDA